MAFSVNNLSNKLLEFIDQVLVEIAESNKEKRIPFGDNIQLVEVDVYGDPDCVSRVAVVGIKENCAGNISVEVPIEFSRYSAHGSDFATMDIALVINGIAVANVTQTMNEEFFAEVDKMLEREAVFGKMKSKLGIFVPKEKKIILN